MTAVRLKPSPCGVARNGTVGGPNQRCSATALAERTREQRMRIHSYRLSSVLLLSVWAGACSGEAVQSTPPSAGRGGPQNAAVPVTTAPVVQKTMPIEIEAIGTVIAASTVAVRAQITGELVSVNFREGEDVKEGQVLVTLDKRPLEAALQQAQSTLNRDLAQLTNAKAQAARYQDLVQRGIVARDQFDQISTTAAALEATVGADRAAVENARLQLGYD